MRQYLIDTIKGLLKEMKKGWLNIFDFLTCDDLNVMTREGWEEINKNKMTIDYESEVKKVYPDAAICPYYLFGVAFKYFVEDVSTGEQVSKTEWEPADAWQAAYNDLKSKQQI